MAQGLMNFLKDCKVTRIQNSAAAAQTSLTTSVLDMSGYDSIAFVTSFGAVTSGSVLTIQAQQNTANSAVTPTNITGAVIGPITDAGTNGNAVYLLDVMRPVQRYVFVLLTRTAQNAAVDSIIAIQYNAKALPVTQDATTVLQSVLALVQ